MVKSKNPTFSHITKPRTETPMEKTTRIVREMLDSETESRQVRTSRLRKARLEREAGTPNEAATPKRAPKKPQPKTVTPT